MIASPQMTPSMTRGKGVWAAAATRFKTDRVGLALPGIFVGSFLIEVFFSIPGLAARYCWRSTAATIR